MNRRLVVPTVLAVATVGLMAGPAFAHLEPSPAWVPAGSQTTIGFTVEHGCGDQPTNQLAMKIPTGVTVVDVPAKSGWTIARDQEPDTITWTDGSLPSDQASTFDIVVRIPDTPGATLEFPTVQTCDEGANNWIEPTAPGDPEPEFPVPTVSVVAAATGTSVAVATAPATTVLPTPISAEHHDEPPADDDAPVGLIIGAVFAGILLIGGVTAIILVRRDSGPVDDPEPESDGGPGSDGEGSDGGSGGGA